MQDARRRKFNHVVFWKVDRLARDSLVFFQVLHEWENIGITYSVASLGVDTNTSHGKFVVGILEQVAELERKDIVDKTNLALKRIKRNIEKKGRYKSCATTKTEKKRQYKTHSTHRKKISIQHGLFRRRLVVVISLYYNRRSYTGNFSCTDLLSAH